MVLLLPSKVPVNGAPYVPMPLVQVHPDMLMLPVNLYDADMEPESLTHCSLAAVSTSYVLFTSDGATAVGHPVSPSAWVGNAATTVAARRTPTDPNSGMWRARIRRVWQSHT